MLQVLSVFVGAGRVSSVEQVAVVGETGIVCMGVHTRACV